MANWFNSFFGRTETPLERTARRSMELRQKEHELNEEFIKNANSGVSIPIGQPASEQTSRFDVTAEGEIPEDVVNGNNSVLGIFNKKEEVSKEDMTAAFDYAMAHPDGIDDEAEDFKALSPAAQQYIKNIAAQQQAEHPEEAEKDKALLAE